MSVPVMSIGIKSGVNWIRLKSSDIVSATLLTSKVLAKPGTPINNACPREQAYREPLDHLVLPDNHPPQFAPEPRIERSQPINRFDVLVAQVQVGRRVS